jgi:hypothetical protein
MLMGKQDRNLHDIRFLRKPVDDVMAYIDWDSGIPVSDPILCCSRICRYRGKLDKAEPDKGYKSQTSPRNQIIKHNVRQHWQPVWDDLRTEGNRWWIGGRWNEFAKVMGSRWLRIIRTSSVMRYIQEGQI